MKNFKKLLFLLLIVPFCFSFISCKDKSDSDDNGGGNSNKNENVSTECFAVDYDYNLPEKYDFLLTDFTVNNIDLGDTVDLATIPDENLAPHFEGWFDSQDNKVTDSVTSATVKTIKLKGKWNEEAIEKYYYSEGLTFDIDNTNALISGFSSLNTKIVLPNVYVKDSVEYPVVGIKDSVFKDSAIQELIVNADELSVGDESFKNSNVVNFDFSIVKEIGESAFENTKISEIKFCDELTSIGNAAFRDCKSLINVDFSEIETIVPIEAFKGCESLSSIFKAENILSIQTEAFSECVSLTNTNFLKECADLEIIETNAFLNCVNIESAIIPECVIYIDNPFEGCEKLSDVTLARTFTEDESGSDNIVKHLGDVGDTLKSIKFIGTSATLIPTRYFSDLFELETFVMSDSFLYVRSNAFNNCSKLKNITLSNNLVVDELSSNAFITTKYLNDMVEPLIYKNSIIYVPENIISDYAIPAGVTKINDYAFYSLDNLEKISIPSSVDYIGAGAFKECRNLKEVVFEENNKITKIGNSAFYDCEKLDKINISNLTALAELGTESFKNTNFTTFTIPATVETVGAGSFMYTPITKFAISGTGGKLLIVDDILYMDISESGTGDKLKLLAYPNKKADDIFIVPNNVEEIGIFAFIGANELNYIYFETANVEIEQIRESVFNSFEDSHVILMQDSSLVIDEPGLSIATILTHGCEWDYTNQTVIIEEGNEPESGLYFIKYYDEPNYSIAIFEYKKDGDNSGIVPNSLVKIEKILNS